jgi:hypothetical protein
VQHRDRTVKLLLGSRTAGDPEVNLPEIAIEVVARMVILGLQE